ncbi:hypothetical protein BJY52DRAFT_1213406 [Lactarius psammicola]|nr:hypothetical protein BJY52DRAFT_1213406 [Lactarius psammicola]
MRFSEDDVVLCLSKALDDKALRALMCMGLNTRFPKEYEAWEDRRIDIEKRFLNSLTQQQVEVHITLERKFGDIQAKVREAVIGENLRAFPMLRRESFSSESSSTEPVNPIYSGEAAGTLHDLLTVYPEAASTFRGCIRDFKKERMLILYYLLENYKGLDADQIRSLSDAALVHKDKRKVLELLESFAEERARNAHSYATLISDSRFLSYVPASDLDFLCDAAAECEKIAYGCPTTQLDFLVSIISQQILSIQKVGYDTEVQREVKGEEEKELNATWRASLRIQFVLRALAC